MFKAVPHAQLDTMRKTFLELIMSKENVTTGVLDVLVANMVPAKNRKMKSQDVVSAMRADFQIQKQSQQQTHQMVSFVHHVKRVDGIIKKDVRKNRNV
jgi:hypothetical protein